MDTEQVWQPTQDKPPIVKPRKLTRKRQAFVRELVKDPQATLTEASERAGYSPKSAHQIGSELLKKPEIQAELAKYTGTAENVVIEVMEQSRKRMYDQSKEAVSWAVNARQTADSLLDRVRGKATQRTETVSTSVNLNLNLADVIDSAPQLDKTGKQAGV